MVDEELLSESDIKGQVRPFCIAIDYDDTFSSCRETWGSVIRVLRNAGAKVVCVTSRDPNKHPISDFPGEVFYCSGRAKAKVAFEHNLDVRVWIDDQPEYIGVNPQREALKSAMGVV